MVLAVLISHGMTPNFSSFSGGNAMIMDPDPKLTADRLAVQQVADRAADIQLSLQELLRKLGAGSHADWPALLQSFSVLAAQLKSLLQPRSAPTLGLAGGRGLDDASAIFRNVSLLPVRLSPDLDPDLLRLTEGRIGVWSHAVVPDYLRTKPDRAAELKEAELTEKPGKVDTAAKHTATHNKFIDAFVSQLDSRDTGLEKMADSKMQIQQDAANTASLLAAVVHGKGLQPDGAPQPRQPLPAMGQMGAQEQGPGGKYQPAGRGQMKLAAAAATHPYMRPGNM